MRASRRAIRPVAVFAAIVCSSWSVSSSAIEKSRSYVAAVESIRAEDLQRHVAYLADDALEGREPGTPGGRLAGDYLRAQLENLSVRGAGHDGGFVQPFAAKHRNILGLLQGTDPGLKHEVVVICAHYDHVGFGTEENSRGPIGQIHNGADDNASGTSAVLELAEALTWLPESPKRSILFAFWDGEEEGMLGSKYWAAHPTLPLSQVVAVLNFDMVGRLRDDCLTVYGWRSGKGFRRLLSRHNTETHLRLDFSWELEDDADHYPFFERGIPVLFLHTGLHDQWHSPADDLELINSEGMSRVTRLAFTLLCDLAERPETPAFRQEAGGETEDLRKKLADHAPPLPNRLGVTWSRRADSASGLRVSRIVSRSPAQRAGIRPGDRIVRFANREVRSSDELNSAVLLAHHEVPVVVQRPGRRTPLSLTVQLDGEPMPLGIAWRTDDAEPGTVILTYVVPGSPAADAGLSAGDRIYRVDGRDLADEEAFRELLRTPPESMELLVERDGRLRAVNVDSRREPQNRAVLRPTPPPSTAEVMRAGPPAPKTRSTLAAAS
jgi:hypothetical protein